MTEGFSSIEKYLVGESLRSGPDRKYSLWNMVMGKEGGGLRGKVDLRYLKEVVVWAVVMKEYRVGLMEIGERVEMNNAYSLVEKVGWSEMYLASLLSLYNKNGPRADEGEFEKLSVSGKDMVRRAEELIKESLEMVLERLER